jgi:hypothetical protein
MTTSLLPIALNMDGSIALQPQVRQRLHKFIDLSAYSQVLRLSSSQDVADRFKAELKVFRRSLPSPWLTFIGSGDFHHVTLMLLETLPDPQPFTLILIDNHPDWFFEKPRYHCGNWLSTALSLRHIQRIILIGQDSPDLVWRRFYSAPFEELCEGKLTLYPLNLSRIPVPLRWPRASSHSGPFHRRSWGTQLAFNPIRPGDASTLFTQLSKELANTPIYLSIDKDCLAPEYAACDWEQGGLSLNELTTGIATLTAHCPIIGADITGEHAPAPLQGLWKRLDAGRLFHSNGHPQSASALNEATNLALLDAFDLKGVPA